MTRHSFHNFNQRAAEATRQDASLPSEELTAEAQVHHMTEENVAETDMDKARAVYSGQAASYDWAERPAASGTNASGQQTEHRGSGELAAGHRAVEPIVSGAPGVQLNYQQVTPTAAAVVQWDSSCREAGRFGPLARSVMGHQPIQQLRQDRAGAPDLAGQLGPRSPMGAEGAPRNMPEGTSANHAGPQASPPPHDNHPGAGGIFTLPPFSQRPYRLGKGGN